MPTRSRFLFVLFVLFVMFSLLPAILWADMPVLVLKDASAELISHAEMLEDPKGNLTLESVLAAEANCYQRLPKGAWAWDIGFSRSAYWFRLNLQNHSEETDWYFEQWGSLSRSTELYLAAAGAMAAEDFVKLPPLPHARLIQYHLELPQPDSGHVIYLRVQDQQTPLVIAARLVAAPNMLGWVMDWYPYLSFVTGGLLMLMLYNFFYFLVLKDQSFLILSVLILTFTLEMGGHMGLWHSVAWMRENLASIGAFFGALCAASAVILLRQWLDIPVNLPKLDAVWRYVSQGTIGVALVCPFIPFSLALLGVWIFCLLFPLILISLFLFFRQGSRLPLSLILAGLVFISSLLPALLRSIGLIGEIAGLPEWAATGLLLSLMLLSLYQAEQMRQKQRKAVLTAATNQTKDEFLTTMSHELRTPMTAVVSAGQLLKLTTLSDVQQEYVGRLNTSSRHMLALINDILELAQVDNQALYMDRSEFKLTVLLRQLEDLLGEQARGKHLHLIFNNHFHPLKKQLVGDPVRLQQILLNLLGNAIKFTEQGEVRLNITPQAMSDGNVELLFEVSDTGIGLSQAQQQKLFQPFSQADSSTSRQYGGSGLGLAISFRLVQCMGGELQVESKPDQGSRFFFTLPFPLQAVVSEAETALPTPPTAGALAGCRILLVDDDEMNRFFGSKLLESLGVKVTVAGGGKEALHYLQRNHFDLVFMDVSMAGLDGYATTRSIRSRSYLRGMPIIALTAHAIAGERERCLAAGMDDYLTKPFIREELQAMLQHYLLTGSAVSS